MSWLSEPDGEAPREIEDLDVGRTPYPDIPGVGSGWFEMVELALDMSIFEAVHTFLPAARGRLVPLGRVRSTMRETSLMVQVTSRGRICHRESTPGAEVTFGEGDALFRHSNEIDLVPVLDTSRDIAMTALVVGDSVLARLLGEREAESLLEALGIRDAPAIRVEPIPRHILRHLHTSLSTPLIGMPRKLFAQTRVLEFIGALHDHLVGPAKRHPAELRRKETLARLHRDLANLRERVPSLDELSKEYGVPARALNDAFQKEFGCSIAAHVALTRMKEAKRALEASDVTMKAIANRLGYSHVNNFISAFRRQFGVTPGSVRGGQVSTL